VRQEPPRCNDARDQRETPAPAGEHARSFALRKGNGLRYLAFLLLAALITTGMAAGRPARAANPAHLRDVMYADGVVTLQLTEPTTYQTTFWKSARRFMVDVEATGVDLRISSLPVGSPRLEGVRWNQWKPDSVRIVLDLETSAAPIVLASPPTNVISIRVAPAGSAAARVRPPSTRPTVTRPTVSRPPVVDPFPIMDPEPPAPRPIAKPVKQPIYRPVSDPSPAPPPPVPAAPAAAEKAEIGDIEVVRGDDGRPTRIVVRTDGEISVRPSWWGNHLAIDMPEANGARERIVPVNDPVMLRVRTGTFEGHGRIVVDTTRRINYKLSTLDDGRGFALDCILPAPGDPVPPEEDEGDEETDGTPINAPIGDSLKGKLIVLDPGHGDFDKGARSRWITEKDANLDIARRLRRVLESVGAQVVMTRSDDTFVPLRERPAVAMKLNADAFLSIHCNSSARPTNAGTEVFYRRGDAAARQLALNLYRAHRAQTGLRGRGVKPDSGAPQGGLAVLKHTTVPCALVEIAFVNHPQEGPKLADPTWRQGVAEGLARGLARFMEGQD
jgi:N-acetylmuramoyl-L-alanine amidase